MRSIGIPLLLAAAATQVGAAQVPCTSPTSGQTWDSDTQLDSSRSEWPASPVLAPSFAPAELAGTFRLTLAVTAGGPDTIFVGRMTLRPTPPEFAQPPNAALSTPLIGSTDLLFDRVGGLTLAGPASRDLPGLPPGVLLQWSRARRAFLLVGSGRGYDGSVTEDAGVLLYVFVADHDHVTGRWESGGLLVSIKDRARPQGYFCLDRLRGSGAPPN
jgi:hypothetical protein